LRHSVFTLLLSNLVGRQERVKQQGRDAACPHNPLAPCGRRTG
jgi:hypothetical protein